MEGDKVDESLKRPLTIDIRVYHGGNFIFHPQQTYIGGKTHVIKDIDTLYVTYEYLENVVIGLGYKSTSKIHYRIPWFRMDEGELRLLENTLKEAIKLTQISHKLEIYIDHVDEGENKVHLFLVLTHIT